MRWATLGTGSVDDPGSGRCEKHLGGDDARRLAAEKLERAKVGLLSITPKIVRVWSEAMDSPDPMVRLTAARDASKIIFPKTVFVEATTVTASIDATNDARARFTAAMARLSGRSRELSDAEEARLGLPSPPPPTPLPEAAAPPPVPTADGGDSADGTARALFDSKMARYTPHGGRTVIDAD